MKMEKWKTKCSKTPFKSDHVFVGMSFVYVSLCGAWYTPLQAAKCNCVFFAMPTSMRCHDYKKMNKLKEERNNSTAPTTFI